MRRSKMILMKQARCSQQAYHEQERQLEVPAGKPVSKVVIVWVAHRHAENDEAKENRRRRPGQEYGL